ncbi:PLC-like phosphodiesterase [Lineolata rhizophorae]|uniref:PLC-like phosphodiesterase n=1 Tax=Lineolata rhizophorae TaxID=578093 RepID=A0A6A6NPD4_9PEZI|nr:PLC-like phosphodiesterase [Lineolata rhizophorae]
MGQGGHINLINGSPYDWTSTGSHQYQMSGWEWPDTVRSGSSVQAYVEWDQDPGVHDEDDAGEAYYSITGSPDKFSVHANNRDGFEIVVNLDNFETKNNPRGSTIDVGFEWGFTRNFILSGSAGDYSSSNPPVDWMHQNLETLGDRKLRHICMPGSHDSGMSVLGTKTTGASERNTITQVLNIYDQLKAGARFFDIRPVISNGLFYTGHYSEIEGFWQGGNGQSIDEVIDQINRFTSEYKELVVLDLSHAYNTDNGATSYTDFTQDEWNRLFMQMKAINGRLVDAVAGNEDLTQWTLNNFIGNGDGAVLIFAEMAGGASVDPFKEEGFFSPNNFPVFNQYANTHDVDRMRSDQVSKLKSNRDIVPGGKDGFFLLSWTLTMEDVGDILNPAVSILGFSSKCYYPLFEVFNSFRPQSFPNVIYVDGFGVQLPGNYLFDDFHGNPRPSTDITALAMAVNGIAGKNTYITG